VHPGGSIFPVGEGIGAEQAGWAVVSLTLAAGSPLINTDNDPLITIPGPPGTQAAKAHGCVRLDRTAAGFLPIKTVGTPVMIVSGMGGWGAGAGTGAGG
jgi:hypothetical protein